MVTHFPIKWGCWKKTQDILDVAGTLLNVPKYLWSDVVLGAYILLIEDGFIGSSR